MVRHNYKNLKIWQKSHEFVRDIYILSASLPSDEKFGITSQIRRAAISISLNIAEGSGRGTDKDFKSFLHNAYGSSLEVENLLLLCRDLNLISASTQEELVTKLNGLQRMLNAFITKLH